MADQFGVDIDTLQSALVSLTMTTRGESVTKQYNQIEAEDCRDALAKTVRHRHCSWGWCRHCCGGGGDCGNNGTAVSGGDGGDLWYYCAW